MKGIIFDFDGTLFDSMPMWHSLDKRFLTERGIKPPPGLSDIVKNMTIQQAAAYYAEQFELNMTPAQIVKAVMQLAEKAYCEEIPLKPGAEELVRALAAEGIPFGLASVTFPELLGQALNRFGIRELFAFMLTPKDGLRGKEFPDLYLAGAERLNAAPSEIVVFEDALYAAKTAKAAGFYTIGLYDSEQSAEWPALQALCDRTALSLAEFQNTAFFQTFRYA